MNIRKTPKLLVTSAIDRCAAVAGMFVVAAAFGVGSPPAYAADTWIEIKAPHVTVMANGGTGDARTLAWQIEQIRAVLVKILPWVKVSLDRPFVALAVNNDGRMRALAPTYWQQGGGAKPVSVWVTGRDRHYLAIRSDEKAEDRRHINPHNHAYFSYVRSSSKTAYRPRCRCGSGAAWPACSVILSCEIHTCSSDRPFPGIYVDCARRRGCVSPLSWAPLANPESSPGRTSHDSMRILGRWYTSFSSRTTG